MKTLISLLSVVCLFCQCSKQTVNPDIAIIGRFNQEFNLKYDQQISLKDSLASGENKGNELVIHLSQLENNRCPQGATCITGGGVFIALRVSLSPSIAPIQTVYLVRGDARAYENLGPANKTDSAQFQIENFTYVVYLKSVDPLPQMGSNKRENTTATLKVVKQ